MILNAIATMVRQVLNQRVSKIKANGLTIPLIDSLLLNLALKREHKNIEWERTHNCDMYIFKPVEWHQANEDKYAIFDDGHPVFIADTKEEAKAWIDRHRDELGKACLILTGGCCSPKIIPN